MIHIKSIYYGVHESTDYTVSIQIYLDKAIFEEKHFPTPDIRLDANDE